jgi:hypothetical protein
MIYNIGHGVITSLHIEGNQVAYQKKVYIMMDRRVKNITKRRTSIKAGILSAKRMQDT